VSFVPEQKATFSPIVAFHSFDWLMSFVKVKKKHDGKSEGT
jgi:hypothetical protein